MARYKQYEGYQMTRSKKLSVNNDSVVAFMPIKPIYAAKLIKGKKMIPTLFKTLPLPTII